VSAFEIRIVQQPFDVGEEVARLAHDPAVGAIATFVGLCRESNDGRGVHSMTLEHYPGMTEKAIEAIVAQARARWSIRACRVVHRVGRLEPTDPIVLVAVAASHRGDAFAACEFVMDFLKTRAPFWKKERGGDGERWVEARGSDREAAARWRQ